LDLEEKNKTLTKNTHSKSSSFDDSFKDNCNFMIEKVKDDNEKKKTNKNFFNQSSHR